MTLRTPLHRTFYWPLMATSRTSDDGCKFYDGCLSVVYRTCQCCTAYDLPSELDIKNEVVAATADAIDNVKATGMGILTSMMMPILRDDENILHYRSFNFSVMIL